MPFVSIFFTKEIVFFFYAIIVHEFKRKEMTMTDTLKWIKERHSVRQYHNIPIEEEKREALNKAVEEINHEANLNIQVFYDEPKCFDSMMAHYGKFSGVINYICLVGKKADDLEDRLGYYGEKLVLLAQSLGLNTCWVAMTHGKSKAEIHKGEKQVCLISLGYGMTQGIQHKSKTFEDVTDIEGEASQWFIDGVNAALYAPTAMNQQKFVFEWKNGEAHAKVSGMGFYTKLDLGIVKYHFDSVSGKKVN